MGHLDFGTMQRLNIEAARKHAGQSDLVTPSGPPTATGGGGNNGGGTPISLNTPDILNSILNINPFFETPSTSSTTPSNLGNPTSTFSSCSESVAGTPEEQEKKVFATLETPISNVSSSSTLVTNTFGGILGASSTASSSSCSTSTSLPSLSLPHPSTQPPPSVELMRSKLIKEGLKHSIQSKRKSCGKGELDVRAELVVKQRKKEELTPEDEERRRRRRERNKIAATKCRNKKKEKTLLLIQESEELEGNNIRFKSEISKLENERQELEKALVEHVPVCCRVTTSTNLNDSRGGTSGGGGSTGGGGGGGSRSMNTSHLMMSPPFSSSHHQQSCYTSPGHTPHYSQFQGGSGGLPHHHHNNYYNNNTSIQLS